MARALTADNWVAALKRWGIPFVEEPGWRTRENSRGWGEVEAFLLHHTGDDAPDTADLKVVTEGRPGLSGPLCNAGLDDGGRVHLVAAGAANHAGGGDAAVLRAAIAKGPLPAPRYSHDQLGQYPDAVIGNPRMAGVESFYYAEDSPAQRQMMTRLAAAWIDGMNRQNGTAWGAERVLGHREWQRGKVDPRVFGTDSLDKMRAEVAAYLKAGPNGGFLMALDDKQQQELYDRATNASVHAQSVNTRVQTQVNPALAALSKSLTAIAQQVGGVAAQTAAAAEAAVEKAIEESLSPEDIAAAIPAGIAQQVLDQLVARLNTAPKETPQ
jgi:hypothetical protein